MTTAGTHGPDAADDQVIDEAALEAAAATQMRRLHPFTPFLRSWRLVGILSAVALSVFRDDLNRVMWVWRALHGDFEVSLVARAAAITASVAAVIVFGAWLSWRATGFAIVDDATGSGTLLFHRGILAKQRDQVRLRRVQSVDVNQPLVPRLLGLAAVQLDMAAGNDASVNLAYMPFDEASSLRLEILRRMSGVPSADAVDAEVPPGGEGIAADPGEHGGGRPTSSRDELIAEVSTEQVIKSNLLDGIGAWVILLVWIIGLAVAAIVMGGTAFLAAFSGVIAVTIAILAQLRRQVVSMMRDADFKLYRTPTGVRVSSGMTSTVNRTIDYDRIQGVRLVEPFWWRRFGWARVKLDIAGGKDDFDSGASLIPVADRPVALALIAAVTGADFDSPHYAGVPAGARTLDPIEWRFLAVALVETGALSRSGRWRRSTAYVPYARVQSVSARQGLIQRRRGLATVYLDLAKGSKRWEAKHRELSDAAELVGELGIRARLHRLAVGAAGHGSDGDGPAGDGRDRPEPVPGLDGG
jgi:putative membrane protein